MENDVQEQLLAAGGKRLTGSYFAGRELTLTFEGNIAVTIPLDDDKQPGWLVQVNADGTFYPLPKLEPGSYSLTHAFK